MRSTMQEAPLTVARMLRHSTAVHTDARVATWTGTAARYRSYGDLGVRCARLAHALRALGVTGDQRVGTFMWNNAEHLEAYLAVPAMGAVLHTINLRFSQQQLVYTINHAEDRVILVNETTLPRFAELLPELPTVEHVVVVGSGAPTAVHSAGRLTHDYEELLAAQPDRHAWPDPDENSAAALCYTSGTTGKPKGVAYSHRSVYLHSMAVNTPAAHEMRPADVLLPVVPMFHVNAWGMPYAAFLAGAGQLLPDRFLQPESLVAMIERERPTMAAAVSTTWSGVAEHLRTRPADISCLRMVLAGGATCPPTLIREFEERHGVQVVQGYGMTETSPIAAVAHPPAGVSGDEAWPYRISQGRLLPSLEARLIGLDGKPLPHDGKAVGELELRGPWIASSYYRPEPADRDAQGRFVDGWLRTGDIGTLTPDGFLTLTDRAKDLIRSGDEWISSVELESQLMTHPAVAEAAVIAVPDSRWQERPLAAVVFQAGRRAPLAELRDFLAGRIDWWQVPERWSVIPEVPKTSVGKFDKKELRRRYADGTLDVTVLEQD
ncbi:MAG TPA: long-chain fatty acid--CoA ligase [Actinophytocola sp.]|uniref:long-chain fatty acid--CoA ligase n=1 Tax=Actinophytocola sp. TaxID=1872138 RepID=UPI002DDCA557|nr:long-chain fatty acid--CoA ligase [Actinophytocola sp.]HEV2780580.1 long-chain fatty acid--CoA ligase [Actinophytocola sp.]